jgi:hypothetical protein
MLLLSLLMGCRPGANAQRVFPVCGQIFFQRSPAEGALVILQPLSTVRDRPATLAFPHAVVAADGTFCMSTFGEGDGAPVGQYVLLVRWPTESAADEAGETEGSGERTASYGTQLVNKDRFQGRYMNADSSDFRVTVEAKENDLGRFDLR